MMEYGARAGRYRLHLAAEDVDKHEELLKTVLSQAYNATND
jgi:hypothetical protein